MFIRLFYFLLYIFILVHCKIEIKDANVAALSREEIGMIFYITIENTNFCPYEVKVNMIECTEVITEKDKDANFMYLIGGHMGVLKPQCFKNLTIIYPNMYLHNRRGFCLISIKFKSYADELFQRKANISFDTYVTKKDVPHVMRGYYRKAEVSTCESVDQDPLNHCSPVDCHMKYLGTRNYYNKKVQRCEKVPLCISDPSKDMPNIIYSTGSNKCRDMEVTVTRGDLETIESGLAEKGTPCEGDYLSKLNINCHFGKLNNNTGTCDCHEGWTSAPISKDRSPAQGLFVFHECNMESSDWYDTDSRKLKLICLIVGILAVILAMLVILCSFLIQLCYDCIRSFEKCATNSSKQKKTSASTKTKQQQKRKRSKGAQSSANSSDKECRKDRQGKQGKQGKQGQQGKQSQQGNEKRRERSHRSRKDNQSQSSRTTPSKKSSRSRTTSANTTSEGTSKSTSTRKKR